jgi:hypothetical protein
MIALAVSVAALFAHTAVASAASIEGSWVGITHHREGPLRPPVVISIERLSMGQQAGFVVYSATRGFPITCRGPVRYLGRSPRGGYRFLYRERNLAAIKKRNCTAGDHILLSRIPGGLFIRVSGRHWGGDVYFGHLRRLGRPLA